MGYGKFVFRDFSAKQNIKKRSFTLQFNPFLDNEKSHSPNGRVICDLHSPDTFDTRLGERASANVQPCFIYHLASRSHLIFKKKSKFILISGSGGTCVCCG